MSHFRPRQHNLFQSTPPVRGATELAAAAAIITTISIHAPRAGGDIKVRPPIKGGYYFNPRPPCGGRLIRGYAVRRERGISIHAPRAGGDFMDAVDRGEIPEISIHAPRAGGDSCYTAGLYNPAHFNPRPPCGGRPQTMGGMSPAMKISIHAPRAGGDEYDAGAVKHHARISIHAPRAGGDC